MKKKIIYEIVCWLCLYGFILIEKCEKSMRRL